MKPSSDVKDHKCLVTRDLCTDAQTSVSSGVTNVDAVNSRWCYFSCIKKNIKSILDALAQLRNATTSLFLKITSFTISSYASSCFFIKAIFRLNHHKNVKT